MNRIIIDGFALVYRSHYAFENLRTSSGVSSGSIYGFLTTIRSLRKRFPDFHFVVIWDSKPIRKKNLYSSYKENRTSISSSLPISDLKDILCCANIDQVSVEGEEADDVIASYVKKHDGEGLIYIYGADKDLLQLVKDGKVIAIKPKTGKYEEEIFDEEAVSKKFGVYPSQIACYLAFRGDNSDNIPGVPRIPSSLIGSLIKKYDNPRAIYASLSNEKLTDFQKKSITENEQQIYVNYELTLLKDDLYFHVIKGISDVNKFEYLTQIYEIKTINPSSFVNMFSNESSFNKRTQISLKVHSLF